MQRLNAAVAELMRDVALTTILPRFRNLTTVDVVEKSPGELVTIADREAEERLTEGLRKIDPDACIIGEEAVAADPAALDLLGAPELWIIDPIDGTANFAAGRPPFGIMIAHARHGQVDAGWIYDPLADRLCHAALGEGAWLNGEPLRVRPYKDARRVAALAAQFLKEEQRERLLRHAGSVFDLVPIPRCAAEQYPRLCLGENDIGFFQRTLPWDHAAGSLLLSEAGGKVARWDGSEYRLDDGKLGLIAASDTEIWRLAHETFFDGHAGLQAGPGLPLD